ncbi:toll/interleukin-1 receptor domain-containing protein [Agrobacterium leguminum]|uniref:toll/interleukin-1 receptor domain-containing protein n=1 Tax=Agrobacterium leguminum TaxID=2792015 RepID=UPI00272CA56C|nr:toll/interleukin-1 receptor domain-containing protein [Agrobacterium leguminum]WLD95984.1 toll/interleukin-1 receptor domain-containing protein [Agrobacterium leguminum]
MSTWSYQVILMGAKDSRLISLKRAIGARAAELGLNPSGIAFIDDGDFDNKYDRKKPTFGVYFGHSERTVPRALHQLVQDSIVVAPVVTSKKNVTFEIPSELQHINVLEVSSGGNNISRLVTLAFETFRLIRKERGIFISYRRKGSQPLANRLYEELDKRGFDVFIDVRSVPPAVDFQAELWHRMSDVDTIVLIDTPGFREGRWTKAELAQANLLGIQTLHLLWPGQQEDRNYAFSRYVKLLNSDFTGRSPGRGASIKPAVINKICEMAEELRAESIALRHAHLLDNFCDAARDLAFEPTVQPERWISVDLKNGKSLAVVPAVGRPTADRINVIFDSISEHNSSRSPIWAIYDSRGIHENWVNHLSWLDGHLPIRTVSVANVPDALKGLI